MDAKQKNASGELASGERFNRYTIVRPIGEGGMALVYEAIHADLHKRVALKTLLPWVALRTDLVQRFMIEARAASRLSHPHVLAIHDIGVERDIPFLAMDLLEGADLATTLGRLGPLPVERIADIFLPIISALAAAHRAGILHRDIKPENIFLARRPPFGEHPVLVDFGLSKFDADAPLQSLTASGEIVGTPPFMAPEQVLGGMDMYTARSDQYALAVAIYECASGALPYDDPDTRALFQAIARGGAPTLAARRPSVPGAFSDVIERAMSHDPDDRYPSMRVFGAALLPFADPARRALWSSEFAESSAARSTLELVPFRVADLQAVSALAGASSSDLGRAAATGEIIEVRVGSSIFVQGMAGSSCFLLASGEVELTRTHGASTWEVARLGRGSILGLSALWDNGPRAVSAVASADCVLVEISREAFAKFDTVCPDVAERLLSYAIAQALDRAASGGRYVAKIASRQGAGVSVKASVKFASSLREWSIPIPS